MKKSLTTGLASAFLIGTAITALAGIPDFKTLQSEGKAHKIPTRFSDPRRLNPFQTPPQEGVKLNSRLNASSMTDRQKAPARITDKGSSIYGWSYYGSPNGLYELDGTNWVNVWADPYDDIAGYYTTSLGFLKDGHIIGYAPNSFNGAIYGLDIVTYDFKTGEILNYETVESTGNFECFAYNPTDGYVYGPGINYAHSESEFVFMKAPASNLGQTEVVKADILAGDYDAMLRSICYNDVDGYFYGVNAHGSFVKVDTQGNIEELFGLFPADQEWPFNSGYHTGLIYSQIEDCYYWSYSTYDYPDYFKLGKIDVNAKTLETLGNAPDAFYFFVSPDNVVADTQAPKAAEYISREFVDGATSGKVTFRIPTESLNGDALSGSLEAIPVVNGEDFGAALDCTPGQELTVDFNDMAEGMAEVGLSVKSGEYRGPVANTRFWVGYDSPAPTERVSLIEGSGHNGEFGVVWDLVTTSAHGGYVDFSKINYKVYINDELYGTVDGSQGGDDARVLIVNLPQDIPVTVYTASVVVESNGRESEPTYSNAVLTGAPFELPLTFVPTEEQAAITYSSDANEDGTSWTYNPAEQAFYITYPIWNDSNDDWVILPAVNFPDADKYYSIDFEISTTSAYWEDDIQVYIGTSPDPDYMTQTIVPETQSRTLFPMFDKKTNIFKVPSAGKYYIGFRCYSNTANFGLYLRNIVVADNDITDASPNAVNNLDAVAADMGELKASLSFNFPNRTLGGETIPADTEMTAQIATTYGDPFTVSGKPGEKANLTIQAEQGDNLVAVTPYVDGKQGPTESVNVFCGVDAPLPVTVTSIQTSDDMMSMTVNWECSSEGAKGGYVDVENVTYTVYQVLTDAYGQYTQEIATVSEPSYTYIYDPSLHYDLQMDQALIAISASNAAGSSSQYTLAGAVLGTPYDIPYEENFNDGFTLNPWLVFRPNDLYTAQMGIYSFQQIGGMQDFEGAGLCVMGDPDQFGQIDLPRFTTIGRTEAAVKMNAYVGEMCGEVKVYAYCSGDDTLVEIGKFAADPDNNGFADIAFALPEKFMGKGWVQIKLDFAFSTDHIFCAFRSIGVTDDLTGVTDIMTPARKVLASKGEITLVGFEGEKVSLVTPAGIVMATETVAAPTRTFSVPAGIYMISTENGSYKTIVK